LEIQNLVNVAFVLRQNQKRLTELFLKNKRIFQKTHELKKA
jgi:hypothetical protein